jgi:hypothetical protein
MHPAAPQDARGDAQNHAKPLEPSEKVAHEPVDSSFADRRTSTTRS